MSAAAADTAPLHKVWPRYGRKTSVTIKLASWQACAVCLSFRHVVRAVYELHAHLMLHLPADPQGKLALPVALYSLQAQVAVLGCVLFAACLSERWLLHI